MKLFLTLLVLLISTELFAYDASRYIEKKDSSLATLSQVGDEWVVTEKRYDSETGIAASGIIDLVTERDLRDEKTRLQKKIDDINTLLTEMGLTP